MDAKNLMEILKNISTKEVETNSQVELIFKVDGKEYSVDEVAKLIENMDVENLTVDDINYLSSLYRRLESDNIYNDLYSNEEALVGPLYQKINEYEHLVENRDFTSNQIALDKLKTHNNNLANMRIINLKSYESDSNYDLDYLSIIKEDGTVELVSLTDPDYLERFVTEYAGAIDSMSAADFANAIKNSTESNLDFVRLDDYLTNKDVQNKMPSPAIKDNNVLGYELDEVRRLVNQFTPGSDIYICVDRNGEIFYKAEDGIIKGTTHDGKREVKFIQTPSKFRENKEVDTTSAKSEIDEAKNQDPNVVQTEEKEVGGMEVKVVFDKARFLELYEDYDMIFSGDNEDLKNEFVNQMNALFDLCFVQQVDPELIGCINEYYNNRKEVFTSVSKNTNLLNSGDEMTLQEFNLMSKLDDAYKTQINSEVQEKVNDEVNEFGIEGETRKESKGKVRTLDKKPDKNTHHGVSLIAIILEILTVAMLVSVVLSLDI